MSLTIYTGYRVPGYAGQANTYYENVLGWHPNNEDNFVKITGPRDMTPPDVENARGPIADGNLWENDLSMIDETSLIFVCTRLVEGYGEMGSTSVSDIDVTMIGEART